MEEHPLDLNDLLCTLSKKEGVLDHSRVVVIMKRRLPLIKDYLEQVLLEGQRAESVLEPRVDGC